MFVCFFRHFRLNYTATSGIFQEDQSFPVIITDFSESINYSNFHLTWEETTLTFMSENISIHSNFPPKKSHTARTVPWQDTVVVSSALFQGTNVGF